MKETKDRAVSPLYPHQKEFLLRAAEDKDQPSASNFQDFPLKKQIEAGLLDNPLETSSVYFQYCINSHSERTLEEIALMKSLLPFPEDAGEGQVIGVCSLLDAAPLLEERGKNVLGMKSYLEKTFGLDNLFEADRFHSKAAASTPYYLGQMLRSFTDHDSRYANDGMVLYTERLVQQLLPAAKSFAQVGEEEAPVHGLLVLDKRSAFAGSFRGPGTCMQLYDHHQKYPFIVIRSIDTNYSHRVNILQTSYTLTHEMIHAQQALDDTDKGEYNKTDLVLFKEALTEALTHFRAPIDIETSGYASAVIALLEMLPKEIMDSREEYLHEMNQKKTLLLALEDFAEKAGCDPKAALEKFTRLHKDLKKQREADWDSWLKRLAITDK